MGGQGSGRGLGPRVLGSLGSHTPYKVCPAACVTRVTRGPELGAADPLRRGAGKHPECRGQVVDQRELGKDAGAGCTTILLGGCFSLLPPAMRKGGGEAGRRKE